MGLNTGVASTTAIMKMRSGEKRKGSSVEEYHSGRCGLFRRGYLMRLLVRRLLSVDVPGAMCCAGEVCHGGIQWINDTMTGQLKQRKSFLRSSEVMALFGGSEGKTLCGW
jgi:hypothetical protein